MVLFFIFAFERIDDMTEFEEKPSDGRLADSTGGRSHAGFPSPAEDYMTQAIDLNKELVRHPAATFYGRAVGDSMADAGVEDGDILVIDRALEARDGDMAVCFVDGEFMLKRLRIREGQLELEPAEGKCRTVEVKEGMDFRMWGVVTFVIKRIR